MSIFLTQEEVAELTAFKRHGKQIAALRQMGIPCTVNPAGRPIVTRAVLEGISEAAAGKPKSVGGWGSNKSKNT